MATEETAVFTQHPYCPRLKMILCRKGTNALVTFFRVNLIIASIMNIVIVGTGNVAQVLGTMLLQANHTILQVFGRNEEAAKQCAHRLQAAAVTQLSLLSKAAEVCIIATSDSAVPAVAAQLQLPDTIIVHTSGGVVMDVLNMHPQYGVLYPLQSLRKELPYLPKVPLFIDGNSAAAKDTITALAKTISDEVHFAGDEERLQLHVSAVFCSNFTNHLFALANEFCDSEQLSFRYLMPLIEETVNRMQFEAPAQLQTGPAVRGDEHTIARHLRILERHPLLARIYEVLTQSIREYNAKAQAVDKQ